MRAKPFLDTSVLVYVLTADETRSSVAEELLSQGATISVQVLNEFANVARRKLKMPWEEVEHTLHAIRAVCDEPVPVTLAVHEVGLRIAQRYRYSIYDSMLLAAAQQANCSLMYSEDMQDGQTIGNLTIRNPFRPLLQ